MNSAVDFQPKQIVCLEYEGTQLYGEVIQIVESRQMTWLRPLMLAISPSDRNSDQLEPSLYDLRQGADLLWPTFFFRPALDTEVVPLFTHLQISKTHTDRTSIAHQQLQLFVRRVWQAYQNKF
ncbi:MAG TPA: hypothetical protein V6D28_05625 [Leptolyngbyaceae cyanobacterium]